MEMLRHLHFKSNISFGFSKENQLQHRLKPMEIRLTGSEHGLWKYKERFGPTHSNMHTDK